MLKFEERAGASEKFASKPSSPILPTIFPIIACIISQLLSSIIHSPSSSCIETGEGFLIMSAEHGELK